MQGSKLKYSTNYFLSTTFLEVFTYLMFYDESVSYFGPQNSKNVLNDALDSTESLSVF